MHFGRVARLRVTVFDSVGQLAALTRILSDSKANLKTVNFERAFVTGASVGYTQFVFTIEVCYSKSGFVKL